MFTLPLKKVGVRLVPRSPSHHASEFASCRSQASVATWPKLQRELEKDVERARRDFGDLKTVVVASAFLASVGVFGVAGTVNVQWGEELSFDTALMGLLGNSGIA